MKRLLLLFWIIVLAEVGQAQQRTTVFFEGLGTGLLTSIGVDQLVKITPSYKIALNGALGFFPLNGRKMYSVPVSGSLLLGRESHFFELGIGMAYAQFRQHWKNPMILLNDAGMYPTSEKYHVNKLVEREQYLFVTTRVGYRFQKPEGGWFFKVGITPLSSIFWEDKSIYKGDNPYPSITHRKSWGKIDRTFLLWGGVAVGYTLK